MFPLPDASPSPVTPFQVHSGRIHVGPTAGTQVAVKRSHPKCQLSGEDFRKEIELLSRLRHRNLVSLLGFCLEGSEKLLVYEFVPLGTLRNQLDGERRDGASACALLGSSPAWMRGCVLVDSHADFLCM